MPAPSHARIGFYTARPGDLDHVLDRARDEVIPMLESETGFRRYTVVRTGPDRLVSITGWDSHADAQMAARRLSAWVAEVMGEALLSVENHIAEVLSVTESSPATPVHGRVARWHLMPGTFDALRDAMGREYAPLLARQPGFVRHVIFRTGDDAAMTFAGFASRAHAEAAEAATRAWMTEHVDPSVASVERQEGAVVWSVRKE